MPKSFEGVMREWKQDKLHSGSKHGPPVRSQEQAEAIAFSEDRKLHGPSGDHHRRMVVRHALGLAHHMTKLRRLGQLT
jgi:hypothetical protein